jgi:hypothetical protein
LTKTKTPLASLRHRRHNAILEPLLIPPPQKKRNRKTNTYLFQFNYIIIMPSRYKITEPHPTARNYIHSGRGGAGNTFKAPKTTDGATASGPASLFTTGLPQTSSKFSSGRGGAGNIHSSSEKAIFSFDEELERQSTRDEKMKQGAVWHVGRGGAGNWTTSVAGSSRKDSSSSAGSDASERSGFFSRLSSSFERR